MYWEADKALRVLLSPLRILSLCQQQKLLAPGWHASSFCPLCSSHFPPAAPPFKPPVPCPGLQPPFQRVRTDQ